MSEYIHKSHNVTVLLYHLVFPAKYRRAGFDERFGCLRPELGSAELTVEARPRGAHRRSQVDAVLKEVCLEIEKRYEIKFVEIGVDKDHVPSIVGTCRYR